ncbi:MAG TPA: methylated-DNA--[protein]-cysteine S-methyltransferase [Candidatus Dormibacteraeota bacterium]
MGPVNVRDLRVAAPPTLSFSVLERVGIFDTYTATELEPVGVVYVASNPRGVSHVDVAPDPDTFEADFWRHFGRPVRRGKVPAAALRALEAGRTTGFDVDLRGVGDFHREALTAARHIPRGEVRSYSWVAREIHRERAVRAVGSAMAQNPIPLLIPCHRVVRNDGRIGEYGLGGPDVKRRLLRHEGLEPAELERLAARGVRLLGSDTTRISCLPSCHHARRTAPRHLVEFASTDAARAAGYRACKHCRPFE